MTENKYYVYEWFIKDTGEVFYVGKGCGNRYKKVARRNKFFLDMYHSHNCDVRLIATGLSEEQAYKLEYERVMFYKNLFVYRLTNQTDGGDGTRGYHPKPEQIEKIRKASIDRWMDPEWKKSVIEARHAPESTYQSPEFKAKISALVKGENNPNYAHYWTDEMKDNLRRKQKASGRYEGSKNPNAKSIQCVETGEIFSCIKDAMTKYGVKHPASFSVAIDNPVRTAAKLHWISVK